MVSCCSENEIVVHDSDWYYRKVSVDDSKKNVIANGKTYVDIDHALKDINQNENIVFNLTDDYPEVISLSYGYHVKLDFGKYLLRVIWKILLTWKLRQEDLMEGMRRTPFISAQLSR